MHNSLRFGIIPLAALIVFMAACDTDADNGEGEETQPGVISVKVTPNPYIVHRGYAQTFFVAVSGTGDKAVTWSIEGDGLHAGTVIDQSGKLSVSPDEEQTALTIKAVLAADSTKYGTAVVSIPAPTITKVEIGLPDGIVISPWYPANKAIDINSGKTEQLQAKVAGENFPKQDVTWSIVGAVSSGTSINQSGLLTVSSAEAQKKTFTVQAASTVDPAMLDTITVTVQPPTINYFRVVPSSTAISATSPVTFAVTVLGTGNITGLYEIEWAVERNDEYDIAEAKNITMQYPGEDEQTFWDDGTYVKDNVLNISPFEFFGTLDDETEEFTPVDPFLLVVTAKVTSDLTLASSVLTYEVNITPESPAIPTAELRY